MLKSIRLILLLTLGSLTSLCLVLGQADIKELGIFTTLINLKPATAQIFSQQDAWRKVYERLPDLPLENQYVSKETGKVDVNNTLASRLIRYHIFVKNRPPNYRLDWKLTLADYLGAHQYLVETQYPSANTLQQNPMESDRVAIGKLNRKQRDALIDTLVTIFSANLTQTPAPAPTPTPSASPSPATLPKPSATPRLPQPGDAQLLLP